MNPLLNTEVRVGPCGHSLCRDCWRRLPRPLLCPTCRSPCPVPVPVPNFALNALLHGVRAIVEERFQAEEIQFGKALRAEERSIQREERRAKRVKL